jgi:general secretion pathway protein D
MRLLLVSILLAGCASLGDPVVMEAREHVAAGRGEQALALLDKAAKENPARHDYKAEYFRTRDNLVAQWLAQAEVMRAGAQGDVAVALYRRVQKYDAENARARVGIEQFDADARHRVVIINAERLVKEDKYLEAQDALRQVLVENPQNRDARRLQRQIEERTAKPALVTPRLKTVSTQPISLELRDVTLRAVFDTISRTTGVSFVLDRDVRADQKTTLVLRNAAPEELIRLVLATNQLEQKVINETTVLVFPNTPQKLREYQELVVKTFYIANADVRQTANMIRALVKTRDIFIDEKLNLLVIKDTPNAVRLAERLIAAQDLAEPEVMLELEVMEIGSNRLLELGIRFPDSLAYSLVGSAGVPGVVSLPEWLNRGSELVQMRFSNPLFLFSLLQQDGSTSVLANPRIRVKNKEKARIHIGNRVPVITTTAAATGGFVSESVSYLDIGLKLEVEPLIYLDEEVGIKVGLEVSNIAREIRSVSGTLTYEVGTRNAATVLRLKDGETQILAGLISDEDRRTANRVPGVGDMPVVGRLFSQTRDSLTKSEIVLLITPRLVRTLVRPEVRSAEFAAGTEASTGLAPGVVPSLVPLPLQPSTPAEPVPGAAPATPAKPAPSGADQVPFGGVKPPSQ